MLRHAEFILFFRFFFSGFVFVFFYIRREADCISFSILTGSGFFLSFCRFCTRGGWCVLPALPDLLRSARPNRESPPHPALSHTHSGKRPRRPHNTSDAIDTVHLRFLNRRQTPCKTSRCGFDRRRRRRRRQPLVRFFVSRLLAFVYLRWRAMDRHLDFCVHRYSTALVRQPIKKNPHTILIIIIVPLLEKKGEKC